MEHEKIVSELRGLIMDTVRKANSGHTGGALSSLDFATVLYRDVLRYDPDDDQWINRDRFVLSAGHESALLYTMLVSIGYMELDDLKEFRQWGSRTPGHPEIGVAPGVEATTGPLGQGVAMAVGMAVAEEMLRAKFGRDVVRHDTYCLCGDGDLQEPVALGACALAGHWKLGNMTLYYDRNEIQISGATSRADSTEVDQVFKSLGWQVIKVDGHNEIEIREAIGNAMLNQDQPSIIIGDTTMAHGVATMEGQASTHGSPLPPEEIAASKTKAGLDPEKHFYLSNEAKENMRRRQARLRERVSAWKTMLDGRLKDAEFDKLWNGHFGEMDLSELELPEFEPGAKIATRAAFGKVLEAASAVLPGLVGGSADLEPSNNTGGFAKMYGDFGPEKRDGRNVSYGVREFPMGAINNGISLHGGFIPFGATFLVFSDYERPALRLRALQNLHALGIYTHDSIFLGEDGPTHQPVEHIMALRTIPNLCVYRPAEAIETAASMKVMLTDSSRPSALLLSRQGLPVMPADMHDTVHRGVPLGAYELSGAGHSPAVTIFAAGSEVSLAMEVKEVLSDVAVRVISVPCWELFFEQDERYRNSIVSDNGSLKVSLEAGVTMGWEKFTGNDGLNIGIDRFGASAPAGTLAKEFGLDAESVAIKIREVLPDVIRTYS